MESNKEEWGENKTKHEHEHSYASNRKTVTQLHGPVLSNLLRQLRSAINMCFFSRSIRIPYDSVFVSERRRRRNVRNVNKQK